MTLLFWGIGGGIIHLPQLTYGKVKIGGIKLNADIRPDRQKGGC
jgi:hypothetical protein